MYIRFWILPACVGSSSLDSISVISLTSTDPADETPTWAETPSGLLMETVEWEIRELQQQERKSKIQVDLWHSSTERIDGMGYGESCRLMPMADAGISGVYEVVNLDLVIVYRQCCRGSELELNTVVRDFWFLNHLRGSGIVPKVYDVSAVVISSTLIDFFGSQKNANKYGKLKMFTCINNVAQLEIRYIVMEKLRGLSLAVSIATDHPDTHLAGIAGALSYGIRMIKALRQLHSHDVIHGDAHHGNFIIETDIPHIYSKSHGLKLIDFEHGRIFNEIEYTPDTCERFVSRSVWNSPWESKNCIVSFRDDIHRVFVSIAAMMYGVEYWNYLEFISKSFVENRRKEVVVTSLWTRHRMRGEIFEIGDTQQYLGEWYTGRSEFLIRSLIYDRSIVPTIQSLFGRLSRMVLAMESTSRPNYDLILQLLIDIHQLVL